MSVKHISSRIELSFWQIAIALLSQSSSLQRVIRWFYLDIMPNVTKFSKQLDRQRIIRWAIIGLGFGFAIGFLIAIF